MRKGLLFMFALTTLGLTSCGEDDEHVQKTEIPRWRERHARAKYVEKTIKQAFLIWSPAENSE